MLKNIAPDLPVEEARALAVTQGRRAGKAFGKAVAVAAWKTKPCWFIVTTEDRVVSAELQTAEAKRMEAKIPFDQIEPHVAALTSGRSRRCHRRRCRHSRSLN